VKCRRETTIGSYFAFTTRCRAASPETRYI
jgi:hypothetical protein